MTISSTVNKIKYTGNGSTRNFPFPFKIFDKTDLKVILITIADGTEVELPLNSGFAADINTVTEGGEIDTVATYSSAYEILIKRELPETQGTAFPTESNIPELALENGLDRAVMLLQDTSEKINRSILLDEGSDLSDLKFPTPNAGKALVWNATADGLENSDDNIVDAASAQAAAEAAAIATAADAISTAADAASAAASAAAAESGYNDIDTYANLSALSRVEGKVYYASDIDMVFTDDGTNLVLQKSQKITLHELRDPVTGATAVFTAGAWDNLTNVNLGTVPVDAPFWLTSVSSSRMRLNNGYTYRITVKTLGYKCDAHVMRISDGAITEWNGTVAAGYSPAGIESESWAEGVFERSVSGTGTTDWYVQVNCETTRATDGRGRVIPGSLYDTANNRALAIIEIENLGPV